MKRMMETAIDVAVSAVPIEATDDFFGCVCGEVIDDNPAVLRTYRDADDGTLRCWHCDRVLEHVDRHDAGCPARA